MPTEGPHMHPMTAARLRPDQTELEDLRASAALWGQGVSRTYSAIGAPASAWGLPCDLTMRSRYSAACRAPGNGRLQQVLLVILTAGVTRQGKSYTLGHGEDGLGVPRHSAAFEPDSPTAALRDKTRGRGLACRLIWENLDCWSRAEPGLTVAESLAASLSRVG
jgi:hypothetical protein